MTSKCLLVHFPRRLLLCSAKVKYMSNKINAESMKNVTLIGATGFVGKAILKELLLRGHKVTAVVRNLQKLETKHENLNVIEGDATCPDTLALAARGADAVISAYNAG